MELWGYQARHKKLIESAWNNGKRFVLLVLPTGGGKTVIFSVIIAEHIGPSCVIAHRQELVSQISLALARNGVKHNILSPLPVIKLCNRLHMDELGRSYYDLDAKCTVAGVDTLLNRAERLTNWAQSITLVVMDEAHHILKENKWGKAVALFKNAKGLGVTATPDRTDSKGLGKDFEGVADELIIGPPGRTLINSGFLTDYKIYAPPSDLDLTAVPISTATGDYSGKKLASAVKKSKVVGDIVDHYLSLTPGKLGISFLPDVESAMVVAEKFNTMNVPAVVIHAKTPASDRIRWIKEFKNGQLLQLVNVDIFGEGFDLPALEVVSFGRPTQSYSLYSQQFGRVLRVMLNGYTQNWRTLSPTERLFLIAQSQKPSGIILDHVGNVLRHGLPDYRSTWALARREKKKNAQSELLLKVCVKCSRVFERFKVACPYCGFEPLPSVRSGPEFVDGDLTELDPHILAKLRGEIARIDMDPEVYRAELAGKYAPLVGQMSGVKRHVERQKAQGQLRESIALWGGKQRAIGRKDRESYRLFYLTFGVDVLSAQTLGTQNALELSKKVQENL